MIRALPFCTLYNNKTNVKQSQRLGTVLLVKCSKLLGQQAISSYDWRLKSFKWLYLVNFRHPNDVPLSKLHWIDVIGKGMWQGTRKQKSHHSYKNGKLTLSILWSMCVPLCCASYELPRSIQVFWYQVSHSKVMVVWHILLSLQICMSKETITKYIQEKILILKDIRGQSAEWLFWGCYMFNVTTVILKAHPEMPKHEVFRNHTETREEDHCSRQRWSTLGPGYLNARPCTSLASYCLP